MTAEVLSLRNVSVERNEHKKILDISSFAVEQGELIAIVGPNGAGKSTLLQAINLLLPYRGDMRLFGEEIHESRHSVLRRRSAMLFQEALLVSGSVFENVAWPLRFRGMSANEMNIRVHRALADFGCDHLAKRTAKQLSGGEAQRVCIARALVTEPELLLLDEPFSSLDVAMRASMMEEIRAVAKKKGITVLLVTHNFSDVLYFAERAVALFDGRILQDAHPEILMRRPVDERVARLVGMDNILPCSVKKDGEGRFIELAEGIRFAYGGPMAATSLFCCLPGDALRLSGQQENVSADGRVVVEGLIERVMPGIGTCRVLVRFGELLLSVRLPRDDAAGKLDIGGKIRLSFDPAEAHIV